MNLIQPLREQDKGKAEFILPLLDALTEENRFTEGGKDLKHTGNIYRNVMNWVFNLPNEDEFYQTLIKFLEEELNKIENADLKWVVQHFIFE